jgi:hypothetical protein
MAEPDTRPVTTEELLVSSLAQTDALAKLLIEKGLITRRGSEKSFMCACFSRTVGGQRKKTQAGNRT